jgi:hypothetical protein
LKTAGARNRPGFLRDQIMEAADFTNRLDIVLGENASMANADERGAMLDQAIRQVYSKDRPLEVVEDLDGDGTNDVALPKTWEDKFSAVRSIEYPIGEIPPVLIEDSDWQLYRTPDALKLRLLAVTPSAAADQVRLTWTRRHAADGSTVPDADFEAIVDMAAALCCELIARKYTQTGDPSIGADVVNYRSKGQEWSDRAKTLRANYGRHLGLGVDDSDAGGSAGVAIGDVDERMGFGGDRLTHGGRR